MKEDTFKNPVFFVSAIVIFILVLIGAITPTRFGNVSEKLFLFTTNSFGWFYLISVFIFVLFLAVIAISKYGEIRLGPQESKPEFPVFT